VNYKPANPLQKRMLLRIYPSAPEYRQHMHRPVFMGGTICLTSMMA